MALSCDIRLNYLFDRRLEVSVCIYKTTTKLHIYIFLYTFEGISSYHYSAITFYNNKSYWQ